MIKKEPDHRKAVAESQPRKIGYARVSTDEQSLALQLDALEAEGCAFVFQDTALDTKVDRQGFAAAIAACELGDVLTAWKLDRLSRSLSDLVSLAEVLKGCGTGLKLLTGAGVAIDTTTPQGKLVFGVSEVFAKFERELIREWTKAGMKAARQRGKRMGRLLKLSPDSLNMAAKLRAAGHQWREVVAGARRVHAHTARRARAAPSRTASPNRAGGKVKTAARALPECPQSTVLGNTGGLA